MKRFKTNLYLVWLAAAFATATIALPITAASFIIWAFTGEWRWYWD